MIGELYIIMKSSIYQPSFFEKSKPAGNLFKTFEDIHNYLYANEGLSEQQILEEIIKILFIKFYDEQQNKDLFCISKKEFLNINSKQTQKIFFNRINQLFINTKKAYRSYFDKNDKLKLGLSSLAFSIKKLQNITFKNSGTDENGLAFQKFMGRYSREGRGQFFTPDPIVKVCVKMIQPKKNEKIIDPACGTGGFLFSSLRYIKKRHKDINLKNYMQNNLYGIEINPRISQIAKIKFLIESNTFPKILCDNALNNFKELSLKHNICLDNQFDIVLTNPPFGTQGKITNNKLLSKYKLGHKWIKNNDNYKISNNILSGQTPEILFIERCIQLLRPGGRLGIVLPNGHLENSSLEYLRAYIKANMDILGIILLPQDTFIPYGTGVKTSLLFGQKKSDKLKKDKIFFSQIKKIGYSGSKIKRPIYTTNQYGKNIIDEDFSKVLLDYNQFLKTSSIRSQSSFCIKTNQLKGRFDYGYYLPKNRKLIETLKKLKSVYLYELTDIVKIKPTFLKTDQMVNYVELSDVYTKSYEIINSTPIAFSKLPSRASYEIKTGDIITAVAGNSIGTPKHTTAYVTQEFNQSICTNGFRVLRNFKINPFYLLYYFQTDLFLKQVFMYRTGAAIPAISDEDFSKILIYIPPKKELEKISSVVKKSFYLRQKAKKEMKEITLNEISL